MTLTRRKVLALGAGGLALAGLGLPAWAAETTEEAIASFTGGAEMGEGLLTLTTPEIAENGNTVPVEVSAEGAASIMLLATGNPLPNVATFNFGPLAGARHGSTRIRLAGTQEVMAIARMEDGTFQKASATVKVTIGGCGG